MLAGPCDVFQDLDILLAEFPNRERLEVGVLVLDSGVVHRVGLDVAVEFELFEFSEVEGRF